MFKSIVVAFDGSAHASKALEIGAGLASQAQIPLGIIYVIDRSHMSIPEEMRKMGEIEHLIEPAEKMVVRFENAPASMMSSLAQANADSQAAMFHYADFLVEQAGNSAKSEGVRDARRSRGRSRYFRQRPRGGPDYLRESRIW
jgi:nucleotide-binding universal stress UspA family protein